MSDPNDSVTLPHHDGYENNMTLEEQAAQLEKEGLIPSDDDENAVPEKFRGPDGNIDTEKLLQSYKELEKARNKPPAEDGENDPDFAEDDPRNNVDPADVEISQEQQEAAEEATKAAGLDLDQVSQEFWDEGGLSDETYEALANAGFPPDMVDTYIDGLMFNAKSTENSAYEAVGGKDSYEEMSQWAQENLSEGEIAAYDRAMDSGKDAALMAVQGLHARYAATQSQEPEDTLTTRGSTSKGNTYESYAEMEADMSDPRYANDPAYTKMVEEKALRSNPEY